MEFIGQAIQTNESVFDGMTDKIVECEFIVPDYYEDIVRVVKTEAVPRVKNTTVSGDRLIVDGLVEFRIFYVSDGDSTVNCIAYASDYSLDFDAKDVPPDAFVKVRPTLQNTVCRVLNPRKLSPKTQLVMGAKIYAPKDNAVMLTDEAEDFETMCADINVFNVVAHTVKPLLISDDVDISGNAEHLLKNDVRIEIEDIKIINNKVIVRGNAVIKTLFVTVDGEPETNIEEVPFTHIIDMDNVTDECSCEIKYTVADCMCILKDSDSSDGKSISVDVEAKATARAFKNVKSSVVCDAYNRNHDCTLSRRKLYYETLQSDLNEKLTERVSLEAPDGIAKVIDVTAAPQIVQVSSSDNSITVEGNLDVALVFLNADNQVMSLAKNAPFRKSIPIKDGKARFRLEPDTEIAGLTVSTLGNRADVDCEVALTGLLFAGNIIDAVTSCELKEDARETSAKAPAITLYFAKNGEFVWDIAKNYNSSVAEINELNNIATEVLKEDTMLIIPRR